MTVLLMVVGVLVATGDPATKSAPVPKPASEAKICRVKPNTGTRFPTKTCRTAAQWEQLAEESRRGAEETVNRPSTTPPGN